MDIHIIIDNIGDKNEPLEELIGKSLADDVSFIAEDDKSPGELLTECLCKHFVKAR
jgi:hypothetical protein